MSMLRPLAVSFLAVPLLGCANAPPQLSGAIERLTPDELPRMLPKPVAILSQADLVRLSKQGTAPDAIIARIKQTDSHYALSASELIALHAEGVSAQVLDYIQSARERELLDRASEEINQREQRCAQELKREQAQWRAAGFCDPWWPGYPGYGWNYAYPPPYGGFYWRR